jgi:hypothetical protein
MVCALIIFVPLKCLWSGIAWELLIFASVGIPPIIIFREDIVELYHIWKDYIRGKVPRERIAEE